MILSLISSCASKQIDDNFERMPVPSSFNDITEKVELRDFFGWAWYDRKWFVPKSWRNGRVLLRFGSVNYKAFAFVNGNKAAKHVGGHIPFQADVTELLKFGEQNHITVAVNNEMSDKTLPQGVVVNTFNGTFKQVSPFFDFFPYAGIHRSVLLWFVPNTRIQDLTVVTSTKPDFSTGVIEYDVKYGTSLSTAAESNSRNASDPSHTVEVELLDRNGQSVGKSYTFNGTLVVPRAKLWWPFTMSGDAKPGYLYKLVVRLKLNGTVVDTIYQKVGIRDVKLTKSGLQVNGKLAYLRGFGRHEEQNVGLCSMGKCESMSVMSFFII